MWDGVGDHLLIAKASELVAALHIHPWVEFNWNATIGWLTTAWSARIYRVLLCSFRHSNPDATQNHNSYQNNAESPHSL